VVVGHGRKAIRCIYSQGETVITGGKDSRCVTWSFKDGDLELVKEFSDLGEVTSCCYDNGN